MTSKPEISTSPLTATPTPADTCIHPFELRHTYRLLSSLPLAKKSIDEIEQLADRLASARSLCEVNQLVRLVRQQND